MRLRSATACNSGRAFCATSKSNTLQPRYVATYENDYCDDPPPRRSILPRRSFLTTTSLIATRGCHNRCGFCYLATDGLRMPYRMRASAAGRRRVPGRRPALRGLHRQQSRLAPRLSALALRRAAPAQQNLERRRHHRRHRRSQPDPQHGAGGMHRRLRRLRVALRRQSRRRAQEDAKDQPTTRAACASCTTTASR